MGLAETGSVMRGMIDTLGVRGGVGAGGGGGGAANPSRLLLLCVLLWTLTRSSSWCRVANVTEYF